MSGLIMSGALRADRHVERWIVAHRVGWLDWFSIGLSRVGTLGLVFLAIALVLAVLRRSPALFVLVLAADGVADLLAELVKEATGRHRPPVHRLGPAVGSSSFPSGHAATAFACATMLAASVPRLRVPIFALAVLVALSRLYNGDHYPLDVLAGAALGVLTALLLLGATRRGLLRGRRAS
jgi:undecaprenyl-diphosphatase